MIAALLGMSLGLVAGVRHAFEPDHLAAVTTLAAGEKRASRLVAFATSWGLGHGVMLVGMGGLMFALHAVMPVRIGNALELVVAATLVALGVRALFVSKHVHRGHAGSARLPFAVGLVHGLSGSGALTALAVSRLYSLPEGLAFMALYASGALVGMAVLAGLAGVPLSRLANRPAIARGLVAASGILSLGVGIWWAYPILARF